MTKLKSIGCILAISTLMIMQACKKEKETLNVTSKKKNLCLF